MRAAIYARISSDRDDTRIGVKRQEEECRALIARNGWEFAGLYVDNSISAYSGAKRPRYESLVSDIEGGNYDVVVAWAQDRLTRHPRELEDLVDALNVYGTKVHTVNSGEYDLSTADGRATARIIGAIARQESERKSERVKSAKRASAAEGKNSGGQRPFGWTSANRVEVIPVEMAELVGIKDRFLEGQGISTICIDLNERGVETATGKAWSRTAVRQVLSNPANAGLRRQPDGGVIQAAWDGAWDRATWDTICALLLDPARKTTHKLRSFLLTGIVFDTEGRRLVTGHNNSGRAYRTDTTISPTRNAVAIKADVVEELVTEVVLAASDALELNQPVIPDPIDPSEAIQSELDALAEMYGRGDITAGEWNAARGPLTKRLLQARRSPSKARKPADVKWGRPGLLREMWADMALRERRQAIEVFVDRVVIEPAVLGRNRPAERVRIIPVR